MPFTVAAIGAGVSAAAGIAGGIMQKNAIDKGASQARDALNQGVRLPPTSLARGPRADCRRTRTRLTCWG